MIAAQTPVKKTNMKIFTGFPVGFLKSAGQTVPDRHGINNVKNR